MNIPNMYQKAQNITKTISDIANATKQIENITALLSQNIHSNFLDLEYIIYIYIYSTYSPS